MLAGIDFLVIFVYLVGILLLGTYSGKYVHKSEDYFLAGRLLPWWAIGMSLVVSDIGAIEWAGCAGGAYRFGLTLANFDWIGCVPAMLIGALIFIPYYWRAGVYTVPEYLGKRYNIYVRSIEALLWGIFLAFNLGIIFWAAALALNTLLGWPIWISIIITAAVVGIYTVSGGLSAVVVTDAVQMVILFVGGITIIVLGLWGVGGWGGLIGKIHSLGPQYSNHFKLFLPMDTPTPYPWTGMIFGLALVLSPAYWLGNQAIIQRTLGAKTEWDAKAGTMWGAFLKMFIPFIIVLPGLLALAFFPNLPDGDRALPMLIKSFLPTGLRGLVFAALFAALMSTVDSYLNSAATLWTKDIYQRFLKKEASDQHYLRVGRLVTIFFVLFGVGSAPVASKFPGIFVANQTLLSLIQGPTFALLLLGILSRRVTGWGGLAGLIGGVGLSSGMFAFKAKLFSIQDPFLYIAWWSFVGALVITIVVSRLTQPEKLEKIQGLVYGLATKDIELQNNLKSRVNQ